MEWFYVDEHKRKARKDIRAISPEGYYLRNDGSIDPITYKGKVTINGDRDLCYRHIAKIFLITVRRPDQNCIDHITHHPKDMLINNVLNLRWCTNAENSGFPEARDNRRISMKGKHKGKENPMYGRRGENCPGWKGGISLNHQKRVRLMRLKESG